MTGAFPTPACAGCGYVRTARDLGPALECPKCGLIQTRRKERPGTQTLTQPEDPQPWATTKQWTIADDIEYYIKYVVHSPFRVDEPVHVLTLVGHGLVLAALAVLGVRFGFMTLESFNIMGTFMHLINLVFHEAGHVIFRPFGSLMTILGGSLLQVLVPLILAIAFLLKFKNPFAAAVCTWWVGQSLVDLAPYILDARAGRLPLLGGYTGREMPGIHDWENILNHFEVIRYDREIAEAVQKGGLGLMALAVAWGAFVLLKEWNVTQEARDRAEL